MNEFRTCAELDEIAEELALGTVDGARRAQAISHLESCARCRSVVDELRETGDALLLLAPEEAPPLGFEARVASAMGAPATPTRPTPHRWRRWVVAGAVAAAALVGVVAGRVVVPADRPAGVKVALAGAEGGRATCRAVVIPGRPAQLFVTIDEPRESDAADYVVETQALDNSPNQTVGTLHLVDGHGVLSAPVNGPSDRIRSVRVFQAGQLRYEARF
ncbi:MAG: hypothetical protein M3159_09170 [Actinomycetota bacterium]|nr:hypothetical protein [Actinomycetota bacterium]